MMKLFLKYDGSYGDFGFEILDETACLKYTVSVKNEKTKQKIIIQTPEHQTAAEIFHKNLVLPYFSVHCSGHLYILVPLIKEYFAFAIYGSTYRFLGDIAAGNFSLIDVDKSPVMTQKKCWSPYGDGFELNLFNEEQEIFALCCAVCAAMYLSASDSKPVSISN